MGVVLAAISEGGVSESTAELVRRLDLDAEAPPTLDIGSFKTPVAVKDEASFVTAAAQLTLAKEVLKDWKEQSIFYGTAAEPGSIVLAHAAHAKLMESFNATAKVLTDFIKKQNDGMVAFRTEQRRIAAQEEMARQAAQRKWEEDARKLGADQAAEAERLRKDGFVREAKQLVQVPVVVAPAVGPISQTAPKISGLQERFPFKGKCIDIRATMRAILDGTVSLAFANARGEMEPLIYINESLLNHLAKTRQKDLGIPGCVAEETVSFAKGRS